MADNKDAINKVRRPCYNRDDVAALSYGQVTQLHGEVTITVAAIDTTTDDVSPVVR